MIDREVLKKALANQYQAILLGGAAAFSAVTLSPLPLLLLLGGELVTMPFLLERLRRRVEIERRHAARDTRAMTQEEQYAELGPDAKARFGRLRQLCAQIQSNYRGLSAESRGLLHEQAAKFDAILVSCLRRLWLLRKYDELTASFPEERLRAEVQAVERQLEGGALDPRLREALGKNLEIKQKLLETGSGNQARKSALLAEVDSLEALLQLLLQKSLAATDAEAFSREIDDVLQQVESDAASVQEMEALLGGLPVLGAGSALSEKLRNPMIPPPPPQPQRIPPQRGRR